MIQAIAPPEFRTPLAARAAITAMARQHSVPLKMKIKPSIKNAIGLFTASEFAFSYLAGALFLVAFLFYARQPCTVVESGDTL